MPRKKPGRGYTVETWYNRSARKLSDPPDAVLPSVPVPIGRSVFPTLAAGMKAYNAVREKVDWLTQSPAGRNLIRNGWEPIRVTLKDTDTDAEVCRFDVARIDDPKQFPRR